MELYRLRIRGVVYEKAKPCRRSGRYPVQVQDSSGVWVNVILCRRCSSVVIPDDPMDDHAGG